AGSITRGVLGVGPNLDVLPLAAQNTGSRLRTEQTLEQIQHGFLWVKAWVSLLRPALLFLSTRRDWQPRGSLTGQVSLADRIRPNSVLRRGVGCRTARRL